MQAATFPALAWSSPHTRGSTPGLRTDTRRRCVFPAHAGIDPLPVIRYFMIARLPRTRGDRPIHQVCGNMLALSSPHTRGSTFCAPKDDPRDYVFPAHAGIDPAVLALHLRPWRLPRTRGDRPTAAACSVSPNRSSPHTRGSTWSDCCWRKARYVLPHTRGSTPLEPTRMALQPVFPAHAGIDHDADGTGYIRNRLPRTRGDRPDCR